MVVRLQSVWGAQRNLVIRITLRLRDPRKQKQPGVFVFSNIKKDVDTTVKLSYSVKVLIGNAVLQGT